MTVLAGKQVESVHGEYFKVLKFLKVNFLKRYNINPYFRGSIERYGSYSC